MDDLTLFPGCPVHGKPTKRQSCTKCNAAYMRGYLRRRRISRPDVAIWERARKRAARRGIGFSLVKSAIVIPKVCPALGIPLLRSDRRTANTPSLDRIDPKRGYEAGNVRVISDRANRLKGKRSIVELRKLAASGVEALRAEYALLVTYVERENLLEEVRRKAARGGSAAAEWRRLATFLDRAFSRKLMIEGQGS